MMEITIENWRQFYELRVGPYPGNLKNHLGYSLLCRDDAGTLFLTWGIVDCPIQTIQQRLYLPFKISQVCTLSAWPDGHIRENWGRKNYDPVDVNFHSSFLDGFRLGRLQENVVYIKETECGSRRKKLSLS